MKTITKKWLVEKNACQDGFEWFVEQGKEFESVKLIDLLIKENQLDWANWLIVRVMNYSQYVSYAVFAAEQVIENYEKEFPDDKRPRTAIESAKKCIKNPSDENKKEAARAANSAVDSASWAADWAASRAADSASLSAWSADRAADWAASRAADSASLSAWSASSAARATARAAGWAKILKKILKYGIGLLKENK